MASVFLSYDRDDTERARPVALALEKAGHFVWWDPHIRGGEQFSQKIDEALQAADAVVVLWSKFSIESPWVRDEAAAGRDRACLIPVSLDDAKPPLGFRQYQTIDLSRWKGRGRPAQLKSLLADVEAMGRSSSGLPGAVQPSPAPTTPSEYPASHRSEIASSRPIPWAIVAALALCLFAIGIGAWWLASNRPHVPLVSVAAAGTTPAANEYAQDLLVKLGSLQSTRPEALNLVGSEAQRGKADLIFQVTGSRSAQVSRASLILMDGKDRSLLWSNSFERPLGVEADLKQQLGYTAAQLLGCALEGMNARGGGLDQQTLKTYLSVCAALTDLNATDPAPSLPLLRQIASKAPRFEAVWAQLLDVESRLLVDTLEPDKALVPILRRDIAVARKLNPNMAEAYIAEYRLTSPADFAERSRLLDRAVTGDSENTYALAARARFSENVGRMRHAVDDAHRAVQIDPLSPALRDSYIGALTYGGKFDEAREELQKAERLWPAATSLQLARYRLELRYGDPQKALELIRYLPPGDTRLQEAFLRARIERAPKEVENTIRIARVKYQLIPEAISEFAQTLAEFGRKDELIDTLLGWRHMEKLDALTDVLFRPAFRDLHHDARFMLVAKHLGLLDYWQKSGEWPDLCFDPDLPYDCKKEAAKLDA
jgi:tetratricopeptide (TPR) repeat protein